MYPSACLVLPLFLLSPPAAEAPRREPPPTREVRLVLAAVVRAAEEDAARGPERLRGDALTDAYVRRAAAAAHRDRLAPRAFLVGLGVALDHTGLLPTHPLTRPLLAQAEDEAGRRHRLAVLGQPTLRGRRDWLQHFVVSAALAAQLDPATAEWLGVAKEIRDAHGGSGFSFTDLAADHAGIAFATHLLEEEGDRRLGVLAEQFRAAHYVPRLDDLEDGLSWERFVAKYGGPFDGRFRQASEALRRRVLQGPGFQRGGR